MSYVLKNSSLILNAEEHKEKYLASTDDFTPKVGRTQRIRHRKDRIECSTEQSEPRKGQFLNTRCHTPHNIDNQVTLRILSQKHRFHRFQFSYDRSGRNMLHNPFEPECRTC
jgi:hypothetical protein